jgi:hypothetical protein
VKTQTTAKNESSRLNGMGVKIQLRFTWRQAACKVAEGGLFKNSRKYSRGLYSIRRLAVKCFAPVMALETFRCFSGCACYTMKPFYFEHEFLFVDSRFRAGLKSSVFCRTVVKHAQKEKS